MPFNSTNECVRRADRKPPRAVADVRNVVNTEDAWLGVDIDNYVNDAEP
jgi:hypothetical protein